VLKIPRILKILLFKNGNAPKFFHNPNLLILETPKVPHKINPQFSPIPPRFLNWKG